jgi:hypothetical protein
MSMFSRSLLGILAISVSALAVAQGVPSAPHLTVTEKSTFLLMNSQIRAEVKLTSTQQAAVEKAIAEYGTAQQKLMADRNAPESQVRGLDTSFAKKALAAVDGTQEKKLLSLTVREIGVKALADKEIAKRVGLTKAQSKKVAGLLAKIDKRNLAFDEMVAKGLNDIDGEDPAKANKLRAEIVKSYDSERVKLRKDIKVLESAVVASLTAPQRAKWQALQS